MSHILNSSSAGLQQLKNAQTPDNHLELQVDGVTKLLITPEGLTGDFPSSGGGSVGPAFIANQTAAQAIPNSVNTKVTLTSSYDSDACFTNSRFTPKVAGIYQFNFRAALNYPNTGAAHFTLWLFKNGNYYAKGSICYTPTSMSSVIANSGSTLAQANGTTDYFEMYIYHGSTTSMNTATPLPANANSECAFSAYFVRSI